MVGRICRNLTSVETSGVGLSLFRIAYSLILIGEISQLIYFNKWIFDRLPYLSYAETDPVFLLFGWLILSIMLMFGYHVRIVVVCNYALTLGFFSIFSTFEYHMDFSIVALNFVLIFIPKNDPLSLDRYLIRERLPVITSRGFSLGYNVMLVYLGIAIIYFDSVFHKMGSPMWLRGLGVWLPASIPPATWNDLTPLLDIKPLMYFASYLTLIFEAAALFLLPFRKAHPLLVIVGLGLHFGIVLAFPIPFFGFGVASIYLLLVPDSWYMRIPFFTRFAVPPEIEINKIPKKFAQMSWRLRGAIVFVYATLFLQAISILQSSTGRKFLSLFPASVENEALVMSLKTTKITAPLFGIYPHNVFLDPHFEGYNHVIAIDYVDKRGSLTRLPFIDELGMAGGYNTGRIWAFYTFRSSGPVMDRNQLAQGLSQMTAFWAQKNKVDLSEAKFQISAKRFESPTKWQKGFLRKQLAVPWTAVGVVEWNKGSCNINLQDIESL